MKYDRFQASAVALVVRRRYQLDRDRRGKDWNAPHHMIREHSVQHRLTTNSEALARVTVGFLAVIHVRGRLLTSRHFLRGLRLRP